MNTILPTECEALVAIYNATNGPNWTNNTGWLVIQSPCTWFGVSCMNGNMQTLDLSENELVGVIPPEIENLSSLTTLDLYYNQLTSLPPEIGNLSSLNYLALYNNQLDDIPPEIGNLPSLTWLYLNANQLSDLPPQLANLHNVRHLDLSYNRIAVDDPALLTFLNARDSDWANTQTIAPINLVATPLSETSIHLEWTPIDAQYKPGYYEISAEINGEFVVVGQTNNLQRNTYLIRDLLQGITYPIRIRAHTRPHAGINTHRDADEDDQRNALWSEYSEVVSATTKTEFDEFEEDDACEQAGRIEPNESIQTHNFHALNDTDWAVFTAPTLGIYRIEVTIPRSSKADVDLYYYKDCNKIFEDQFIDTFSPGARIDVQVDTPDEQFYIEIKNNNTQVGSDATYNLSVRKMADLPSTDPNPGGALLPLAPGPAIVVAGRYRFLDLVQGQIDNVALNAYRLFRSKGRNDSEIFFLATNSELPNFDADATLRYLEYGIIDWAKEHLQQENTRKVLTLYLVDHGGPDEFYLDRPNEEILTSNDLHKWLSMLEEEIPELLVNVIIEACRAGSFISQESGSISKANRVIITSSNESYDAYVTFEGAIFSDNFITFLFNERNLGYSFQETHKIVQSHYRSQEPWIDANGNGIPNELDDISIASLRGFHEAGTLGGDWPPYIAEVIYDNDSDENSRITLTSQHHINSTVTFKAEVRHQDNNDAISKVWGVIYPPDYEPPSDNAGSEGNNELNHEELIVFEFSPETEEQDALFVGSYTDFIQAGIYRVVIHAKDNDGLYAQPVTVLIDTSHRVFLPVIVR
ncbi:MAG: leucine-rich repeat domain-containing protein [Chloroflexota bacterium]